MTSQSLTPSQGEVGRERLTPAARRALLGACVGTVIEWFDYALFASFSAILASEIFFPNLAPGIGVLAALSTFGVGFFIRPLGGFVLGRLGDRYGRKPVLVFTLTLMGVATVAVGFLPTYAAVGILSPILLVLLRLIQGFGAGAESAGAIAIVAEYAPLRRRGFYTSFVQTSQIVGSLIASLVFIGVSSLPQDVFLSWGWRIPFYGAALLLGVAFWLRSRLEESDEYVQAVEKARDRTGQDLHPMRTLFTTMKKPLFLGLIVMCALNNASATLSVFTPSYLRNTLHMPAQSVFIVTSVGFFVGIFAGTLAGHLCDRFGFRKIWTAGALITAPGIFLYFMLLDTGSFALVLLAAGASYLLSYATMTGPSPGLLSNVFPTEVRYSGIAAVKETSSALAVGTMPIIATALVLATGGSPWLVATYVAVWCLLGVLALRALGRSIETPAQRNLTVND
ncbi:MFS transporter [Pseudonocardia oroxyli]|uniref:Major Facilitator Superfamily protein n=1 Tax=Pseudonocardia oroxyli TaxID=366584 RepID=A0A1G7TQF1_PSEOR|nr:MFS transporter [Pseudonocardia oroxyli]SDG37547.1 Major Facilitator Superfamily protein [Pseudonocardia oroxyli]